MGRPAGPAGPVDGLADTSAVGTGRQTAGGDAIAVLTLDNPPSEEALREVQQHPQIRSMSVVKLPPAGQMPPWFG